MGIGKPPATEIRHRVGLAPDNVVEHPEAGILQDCADTINIVVRADHPDCAIGFEHAAGFMQPFFGKPVIGGKGIKFVPVIENSLNRRFIRTGQDSPAQLQVVGRVGKDHIDRAFRQTTHDVNAVPLLNSVLNFCRIKA